MEYTVLFLGKEGEGWHSRQEGENRQAGTEVCETAQNPAYLSQV